MVDLAVVDILMGFPISINSSSMIFNLSYYQAIGPLSLPLATRRPWVSQTLLVKFLPPHPFVAI